MYHPVSKLLHWLMALLVIGLLAVGFYMVDYAAPPFKFTLYGWHKALGAIVLMLVFVRAVWWLSQTKPPLVKTLPMWMAPIVHGGHYVFYAMMVVMPLSGWLMSNAAGYGVSVFGWFDLPVLIEKDNDVRMAMGWLHEAAAWVLVAMIVAHVAAALWHHAVKKDDTLTRMMLCGGACLPRSLRHHKRR